MEQKRTEIEIKSKFALISRERREVEWVPTFLQAETTKTLILGSKTRYDLLDETRINLKDGNLQHLFKIWPIPPISQEIFNAVCGLSCRLPKDHDIQFNHILYKEKVLEFLMRLERMEINVVKDPRVSVTTNAFQLSNFNIIKKGLYVGSTGCWQCPNQIPPSIICCTNPHSITNCLGHKVRHVFLRVFPGTGEFYESPFIIDSTPRYGSVDEEGLIDGLFVRPGLFLIDIPEKILEQWKRIEEKQLCAALEKKIISRIALENAGTQSFA